jgi:hypothetical protein
MVVDDEDGGNTQLSTKHLPRTSGTVDDSARGTIERIRIHRAMSDAGDGTPHICSWSAMSRTLTHHERRYARGNSVRTGWYSEHCGDCPQRLAVKSCVAVSSPVPLNQQVVAMHLRRPYREQAGWKCLSGGCLPPCLETVGYRSNLLQWGKCVGVWTLPTLKMLSWNDNTNWTIIQNECTIKLIEKIEWINILYIKW